MPQRQHSSEIEPESFREQHPPAVIDDRNQTNHARDPHKEAGMCSALASVVVTLFPGADRAHVAGLEEVGGRGKAEDDERDHDIHVTIVAPIAGAYQMSKFRQEDEEFREWIASEMCGHANSPHSDLSNLPYCGDRARVYAVQKVEEKG